MLRLRWVECVLLAFLRYRVHYKICMAKTCFYAVAHVRAPTEWFSYRVLESDLLDGLFRGNAHKEIWVMRAWNMCFRFFLNTHISTEVKWWLGTAFNSPWSDSKITSSMQIWRQFLWFPLPESWVAAIICDSNVCDHACALMRVVERIYLLKELCWDHVMTVMNNSGP